MAAIKKEAVEKSVKRNGKKNLAQKELEISKFMMQAQLQGLGEHDQEG